LPPLQEITMDSREVNEIVVKLLAAADKTGDREILHLVGRLSRAATRERSTAFDEMHHLDRKIRQLQDEVKRLDPHNPLLRRPMVSIHHPLSMAGKTVANHAATGRSL
jgi:arsenate reductase-like glutaredoxin family protein